MKLKGSVVIVTGASSGLGLACTQLLVKKGCRVYGLARRKSALTQVRKQLGPMFTGIETDVRVERSVKSAVEGVFRKEGRIDVLINNAGLGKFGPIDTFKQADWNRLMDTNVRGTFLCARAVIPQMKTQNEAAGFGGHIVNVASVAGLLGNAYLGAYNATKFAVRGLSESLMKEVRGDGIKVTCVYPGSIETEFFEVAGVDMSTNPLRAIDVAETIVHLLTGPTNYLVSEVMMRPLRPNG